MFRLTQRRVTLSVAALAAVGSGCSADDESSRPSATTTPDRPAAVTTTGPGEQRRTRDAIRFSKSGDTTLPPISVPPGGTILRWTNEGEVFSLFDETGTIVDSTEPRGKAFLPAGVHTIDVIASGGWALEIPRGHPVRQR